MKKILTFILSFLPFIFCISQQASNWRTYTDMKNVKDIKSFEDGFWAASGGGAFFYNPLADSFIVINKTEGLNGNSLTSLTIDKQGSVWFGSDNGIIDIYNPETKTVNSILDIYNNTERTQKAINSMSSGGDTIYIATDFGVGLVDPNKLIFYDTFFKFGNLPSFIKVNNVNKIDKIYACTNQGLAAQKDGDLNFSAPESWNVYTTNNGLPSNVVFKVIQFNNTIIAATQKGLSKFDGAVWSGFLPQLSGSISDVVVFGNSLIISTGNDIYSYENENLSLIYTSAFPLIKLNILSNNNIVGVSNNGVLNLTEDKLLFPNGPQANQFISLSVDNEGTLWSASGKDNTGVGFYKFDGQQWMNYNMANTPSLPSNGYYTAFSAPDNTTYIGNWGNGFARIKNDNLSIFTTENTDLKGTPEDEDAHFLVITGFASDSKNNIWILNFWAADKKPLSALTPDSAWYQFNVPAASRVLKQQMSLVIDQYDTKWYISQDNTQSGVFYFNENNTLSDPGDDVSGFLNTSSGLNTNTISSVLVDRRGDIWVGTSLGVNVITQAFTITSSSKPQLIVSSIFSLRQQSVNCMAVDPLNQKWIGTNEGLLHVTSDGTALINAYTSKNSPLLSDVIRSIAIDQNTGRIYVGTDAGLTSFVTPSVLPKESFDQLFIYPNPFQIKNEGNLLTIDGLIRDSDLKVLNISGKLIAEFSSPGGRVASWDGRDLNGELVSSGVYLIVAFDKDGNSVLTSKVAILRE